VKGCRLVLLLGMIGLLTTTQLAAQTALGFQITTDHAGFIQMRGFKPPLTVRWSVEFPDIVSYPIVTGGKVFVVDGGNGSEASTLYALDASTGATLWTQPVPAGYGTWIGFAFEHGGLFGATTHTPQFSSGAMFAFSTNDGHQVWNTQLPGQYSFSSATTARNGMAYTGGAGGGGTVYALQESTGQLVWTGSVENGDSSAPAVTDDGVYVSYVCPQTYRFDPKTGQQIWHYSGGCEGGGGDNAAVYHNLVFARDVDATQSAGVVLKASNGSPLANFDSRYPLAFALNYAFVTELSSLSAVNITNGHTLWSATPEPGEGYGCSPLVINDVVYMGTSTGNLKAYSARTGQQVDAVSLGEPVSCNIPYIAPVVGMGAGQGLLVVPAGNKLVALESTALR